MAETITIPEGYMKDTMGRLVPIEMVKPVDKIRNDLVMKMVGQADAVSRQLRIFKEDSFSEIQSFVELSAAEYGKELGGVKGNVSLMSYDGRYKVVRAVSENLVFDERLQVAKGLIDQCIQDWSGDSRPELKVLVNDAFQVDKQGNVNTRRILSLRKFDIEDGRWKKAMSAINDSLTVASSSTYLRIYERVGNTDRWQQLPLDMAAV